MAALVVSNSCVFAAEPAAASVKVAQQPAGVDLLAANPQNDWIHGHAAAAGWTFNDGTLTATARSAPLTSNYALDDFELHVDWRVADGAAVRIGLPKAPANMPPAQEIEINLTEQPGISIRLPQGAKILKVDPKLRGKTHRTIIRRAGSQLTLDCDGTKSRELPVAANERFGLTLAIDSSAKNGQADIESLHLVQSSDTASTKP